MPPHPTPQPAHQESDAAAAVRECAPHAAAAGQPTALRSLAAHVRLWSVVVLGLALDLWSKECAFHTLRQGGHRPLIPNVLELHTTLNPGALFGMGAGHTEVFLLASVLALVLVVWMFAQSPPQRRLTHVGLGAILAGALGNMYDRAFVQLVAPYRDQNVQISAYCVKIESPDGDWIRLNEYPPGEESRVYELSPEVARRLAPVRGYVRDFIKIPTRWYGGRDIWPWVFNVADMLLVGGVGVLAVRLLRDRRSREAASGSDLDAPAERS